MLTRVFLMYYMPMLKVHLLAPLQVDYLILQTYLVFFAKLQEAHSYAIRTAVRRATKVWIAFFEIHFHYWENSLFLKMRRKSRNSARNSRFSQSELNFYTIKISYSESGQKTESTDVYFKIFNSFLFFGENLDFWTWSFSIF